MNISITDKLQDRVTKIVARAEKITVNALDEGRKLSTEEKAEIRRLLDDFNGLAEQLANERGIPFEPVDSISDAQEWLSRPAGRKTKPEGVRNAPEGLQLANYNPIQAMFRNSEKPPMSFGQFLNHVISQQAHPAIRNAFEEGTGSAGGFLVPPAFSTELLQTSVNETVLLKLCRIVPMTSATLNLPVWDDANRSSTLGGLVGRWIGEGATSTAQDGKLREVELRAKKLAVFTSITSELLADVPNAEREIAAQMAAALAWSAENAIINGTGAGQPLGILNATSTVTQAKETSQAAGTIVGNNILKMYSRLHPASYSRAIWLAHPTALPHLLSLSQEAGPSNVDATRTVIVGPDAQLRIMGRPLFISEHCQVVGTRGDLILLDPSQYLIGMRTELAVERDIGQGWYQDTVGLRTIARLDGMPIAAQATTPRTGSTTLSWAVTLETRS